MEVHLNPNGEAKLNRLTGARGGDAEILAREAIERFVNYDEWFLRQVEKGLYQIEQDEVLSHAEAGTRLEKLLAEKRRG